MEEQAKNDVRNIKNKGLDISKLAECKDDEPTPKEDSYQQNVQKSVIPNKGPKKPLKEAAGKTFSIVRDSEDQESYLIEYPSHDERMLENCLPISFILGVALRKGVGRKSKAREKWQKIRSNLLEQQRQSLRDLGLNEVFKEYRRLVEEVPGGERLEVGKDHTLQNCLQFLCDHYKVNEILSGIEFNLKSS